MEIHKVIALYIGAFSYSFSIGILGVLLFTAPVKSDFPNEIMPLVRCNLVLKETDFVVKASAFALRGNGSEADPYELDIGRLNAITANLKPERLVIDGECKYYSVTESGDRIILPSNSFTSRFFFISH